MVTAPVIFVLLALAGQSLVQACDCPPAFNFNGYSITEYGVSRGPPEALESISVCFWMSTPYKYVFGRRRRPTPLSYAAEGSHMGNELLFMMWPTLLVYIKGRRFKTSLHATDGDLHHVCMTWESSSGTLKVYKDGALAKTFVNAKKGQQITGGGVWMIGQDQDIVGGRFEKRDSFKGTVTGVNVWDKVLCDQEIKRVAKDCGSLIQGNYKKYSDFTPSDSTKFIDASCCPDDDVSSSMYVQ